MDDGERNILPIYANRYQCGTMYYIVIIVCSYSKPIKRIQTANKAKTNIYENEKEIPT